MNSKYNQNNLEKTKEYSDMLDDNRNFLEQFIDCYHRKRCLWDTGSQKYLNKEAKCKAYSEMLQIMKIYKANANIADVKKKINILRSSYRRELRKIRLSFSGKEGSEGVYVPNLWWFHKLDFLKNTEKLLEIVPMSLRTATETSISAEETDTIQENSIPRKKFKNNDKSDVAPPSSMVRCPNTPEDEYDYYAKAWVTKLRQMEWTQRLLAERAINEVIYQGQRGFLSDDIMARLNNFSSNINSATTTTQPDTEVQSPNTEIIINEEEDFIAVKSEPLLEHDNDFSMISSHDATSSNSTCVGAVNCNSRPPTLRPIRTSAPNNNIIISSRTESLLEQFFKD